MPKKLLVLGAGPKAVAVAAKAKVLEALGWEGVPELFVLDKAGVAAHWDGTSGFTDGSQLLVTPPEKDIGFPYLSGDWGEKSMEVDDRMLAFSWQRYKILAAQDLPYSTWVDKGRPRPTLKEWADYLRWVASEIPVDPVRGQVTRIGFVEDGSRWRVEFDSDDGERAVETDGLVITGPGTPVNLALQENVFDVVSLWSNLAKFEQDDLDVCVVGVGLTAASVVGALLDHLGAGCRLFVVAPHGFIYSRGDTRIENRFYSDPTGWSDVSEQHRMNFLNRIDRGVFPRRLLQRIDASGITFKCIPGQMSEVFGSPKRPTIRAEDGEDAKLQEFDRVIDARNTNRLWFWNLMEPAVQEKLVKAANLPSDLGGDGPSREVQNEISRRFSSSLDGFLKVGGFQPYLHLPMLAGLQWGPGFPNLTCLGLLSNRILRAYTKE